jgi:hypothetical protein
MIAQKSITKEWIETVAKSKKADKILVEKVIRALILLEGLTESGLNYVFKGLCIAIHKPFYVQQMIMYSNLVYISDNSLIIFSILLDNCT